MEMLLDYEDNDIDKLGSRLAKPGGMIQLPPAAVGAALPSPTLDPAVFISGRASANLRIACYMAQHFERTNRTFTTAFIMNNQLRMQKTN